MTIRQNISRLLLAGWLMAMLSLPMMSVATDNGVAVSQDTHSTLFQANTQDLVGGSNVVYIECNSDGSEGGCGGG